MAGTLGCQNGKNVLLLAKMTVIRQIAATFRSVMAAHEPKIGIEELAEMTGLSRQTISATISGKQPKVSFVTIKTIADTLGLSLDDISGSTNRIMATAERSPHYGTQTPGTVSHQKVRGGKGGESRVEDHKRRAG